MAFIPNRWLTLRLRFEGPFVRCNYSDSFGKIRTFSWSWRESPPPLIFPPSGNSDSISELSDLVKALTDGLPTTRWGENFTDTAPLAAFVEPLVGFPILDVGSQLTEILRSTLPGIRLQCVQLSRTKPVQRTPFQLPLHVLAVGEEAAMALTELENSPWYIQSAEVREFGLLIQVEKEFSRDVLNASAIDVVVTDDVQTVFAGIRGQLKQQRPRLVVFFDDDFRRSTEWTAPAGVAVLRIPALHSDPRAAQFLRAFLYGIIHDFPLHEALTSASLEAGPALFFPVLIADPLSNQSLRIVDALARLKRQSVRWEATLPELDFEPFLERMERSRDPALRYLIPDVRKRMLTVRGIDRETVSAMRFQALNARSLQVSFPHESASLVPMADVQAVFSRMPAGEIPVQNVVEELIADASVSELLRNHQQRFVDVALARLETDPQFGPLSRSDVLQTDTLYELRVHIGNRLPDSIVVGPDAPIDPILPDSDDARGHLLEIAVQSKDFDLSSEPMQTVWLGEFGATEPVYFEVRTPSSLGVKNLRVCVYSQNYLIQTYLLAAEVADTEQPQSESEGDLLKVSLEFSRTDKFSDLDALGARILSIGANSSGSSATHELIVKGDQAAGEITLFPSTYDAEVKKFRRTLESASKDPANPKACRIYPVVPAGQSPGKDVAQTFRDLARQGRDLYDAVFGKTTRTKLRKSLVKVAQTSDEKLQVVRFDDNFVFPWSILYDFALPEELYGQKPASVCLGLVVDSAGNTIGCGHSYKDKVYCVNGFWGVRHYVEELIGEGTNTDPKITRASVDAVRVVADTTLPGVSGLISNLSASLGPAQVTPGPVDPDQLLDLLWADPPQRPTILIVLGHLKMDATKDEPEGARVVLVPKSKWLLRRKISERLGQDDTGWSQPRSMVLMMACESAATEVATVNDFVTAWNAAGAGAIIGTECIVGSNLASDLAEEVTKGLWNGKTLGEAMTGFRRQAVNGGNPLGLVFHAVGDVDLKVN